MGSRRRVDESATEPRFGRRCSFDGGSSSWRASHELASRVTGWMVAAEARLGMRADG